MLPKSKTNGIQNNEEITDMTGLARTFKKYEKQDEIIKKKIFTMTTQAWH